MLSECFSCRHVECLNVGMMCVLAGGVYEFVLGKHSMFVICLGLKGVETCMNACLLNVQEAGRCGVWSCLLNIH